MNAITVKETDFKVGDILMGTGGYNRTYTEWYKIVRTTKCKVFMVELPISYETEYGPNTFGSHCMPVIDDKVDETCPYYFGSFGSDKEVSGIVRKYRDGEPYVKLPGTYGMTLRHWNGKPGWVNCD